MLSLEEYATTEEVAKIKGVRVETVRRWIKLGLVQAIRVGQSYLIPRQSLDQLEVSPRGRPPLRQIVAQIVREVIREELERMDALKNNQKL